MHRTVIAVLFCFLAAALPGQKASQIGGIEAPGSASITAELDVLTQHNNPQRTGAQLAETILTPDVVRSGRFGRLFDWEVDGQIYGQPLYVSHIVLGGRVISMVLVATMNNSVYAFEAPAADSTIQPSAAPIWQVGNDVLGRPLPYKYFHMMWGILGHNIQPLIGIVATPVIDRTRSRIFVTVKYGSGRFLWFPPKAHYRIFALDLLTGHVINSVEITAQYKGPDGAVTSFNPKFQLQRAGLLEANDRLYLAFSSHQDTLPYHGWVLAYDAATLRQAATYCTTCSSVKSGSFSERSIEGGIWQAGGGPASDRDGNVYVMTGNGSSNAPSGDLASSFIKLDRGLKVIGSWTPPNFACLNKTDSDLGSAGPLFLLNRVPSGPDTLMGGGKEGLLYSIRSDILNGPVVGVGKLPNAWDENVDPCGSGEVPANPGDPDRGYSTVQAVPLWASRFIMDLLRGIEPTVVAQGFHHIHGAPVLWNAHDDTGDRTLLYVSAERDLLRAFEWNGRFLKASPPGIEPTDTFHSACANSGWGMPGGFLAVSAHGGDPKSGIIWAAMPRRNKDALTHIVDGVLRAYRAYPENGDKLDELWNSDEGANPSSDTDCEAAAEPTASDELGLFAKYASPTVSEGKVYIATFSNQLVVYGLKTPGVLTRVAAIDIAKSEGYDATLASGTLPSTAEPGTAVVVSVVATNTGSATWRASDGIRLGSQSMPGFDTAVAERSALSVRKDVLPGQTYTFSFRLRVPADEATNYYRWRMVRTGKGAKQASGDWFGRASAEWSLTTLRAACADLRNEATALRAQISLTQKPSNSLVIRIEDLRRKAESRNCTLASDRMNMEIQPVH